MTVRNVTCIRRVVVDGNVYCPDPRVAPHRASIQPPIEALGCSRCARSDWNQLPLGVGRAAIAILGIDLTDSSAKEISPMGRAKVDSPDRPSALLAIVFIGDDCKGKRERERERERSPPLDDSLSLGNENKDARARIVRHSVKDNEASRSS